MPQAIRYSPTAVSGTPLAKNATKAQNEIQNAPYELKAVAPKVLPFLNSHMPASNCAPPPYASASPRTTGSPALSTSPALNMLSTKVVSAKPASPSGAGSAIEVATTSTSSAMGMPPLHTACGGSAYRLIVRFWQVTVKNVRFCSYQANACLAQRHSRRSGHAHAGDRPAQVVFALFAAERRAMSNSVLAN